MNFFDTIYIVLAESFSTGFVGEIFANKYVLILVNLVLFIITVKIINTFIKRVINRIKEHSSDIEFEKQANTLNSIIISIVDTVLGILLLMYILNKLGVDIRPILTAAGVLGVAVGFGAKRFVEDVITGIIILLEGQIRVGDVIQIADKVGTVEKMDLKLVVLRDMQGHVHFIRNGMIDVVTNMTREFSYYVFDIPVAYKEKTDEVVRVLEELDEEFRKVKEFKKFILEPLEILGVDKFDDSAVIIKARYKTKPIKQWLVGREFNRLIKNKFDELDIEIPVPHRKVSYEKE